MADSRGIKAGKAYVELGADDNPLTRVLTGAEKRLKAFGSAALKVGAEFAALGLSIGSSLAGAAVVFANAGSELDDMSQRTGDSVENLSALGYAARQSGSDLQSLEGGLSKMSGTIAGAIAGEKSSVDLLKSIGLTAADLKGKLPTEQLAIFADKIAGISDANQKTDITKSIFGKSGTQLIPLLNEGSAGIAKLTAEASRLGVVMSSDDAASAAAFGDALDALQDATGAVITKIGGALAPILTDVADRLTGFAAAAGEWISQNRGLVVGIGLTASALTALGVAIAGVGVVASVAGTAIGILSAAIGFIASPVGIAIAAIAGIGMLIVTQTDIGRAAVAALGEQFGWLVESVSQTFGAITDAIGMGRMDLAFSVAWASAQVVWQSGIDYLTSSWDTAWIYMEGVLDRFLTVFNDIWQSLSDIIEEPLSYVIAAAQGLNPDDVMKDLQQKNLTDRVKSSESADSRAADRAKRIAATGGPSDALLQSQSDLASSIAEVAVAKAAAEAAKNAPLKDFQNKNLETVVKSGTQQAKEVASVGANLRDSSGAASAIAKALNKSQDPVERAINKSNGLLKDIAKNTDSQIEIVEHEE